MPPAIPMSAPFASPGPFTGQPITAIVSGLFMGATISSTLCASSIRFILVLPQVGQLMRFTPLFLSFRDFKSS